MSEETKTMSPLRRAMNRLDDALSHSLIKISYVDECITDVWDEIDNVEKLDIRYRNTRL